MKSEVGEAGQEVGIGERSPDRNFLALACIVACKADFGQRKFGNFQPQIIYDIIIQFSKLQRQ